MPVVSVAESVELPFDREFEFRVDAGQRLWRALSGSPGAGCMRFTRIADDD